MRRAARPHRQPSLASLPALFTARRPATPPHAPAAARGAPPPPAARHLSSRPPPPHAADAQREARPAHPPPPPPPPPGAHMEQSVAVSVGGAPAGALVLRLTPTEAQIFQTLRATAAAYSPATVVRVAGGWVRDKLLGRDSHDIDIALDDVTGREFAEHVNEYLTSIGVKASTIGVIAANPEQSKHLETATTRVFDLWIDFVNLRAEEYDVASRIPRTTFGTPLQDAERRDFTINSLFFNVTSASIEDWTGQGLADLRAGVLRTPLPPRRTFLDDPLRVLRALRFASRFGFTMVPELVAAATDADVRAALAGKISRERVGTETEAMLSGGRPVASLRTLHACGLTSAVFAVPASLSAALLAGSILDPAGACGGHTHTVAATAAPAAAGASAGAGSGGAPDRGDVDMAGGSEDGGDAVVGAGDGAGAPPPPGGAAGPPPPPAAQLLPPGWPDASARVVEALHYLFASLGPATALLDPHAIDALLLPPAPEVGFCAPRPLHVAVEALPDLSARVGLSPEHRRALVSAAALFPLAPLCCLRKGRQEHLAFAIIAEGMKRKHIEAEDMRAIQDGALGFGMLLEHARSGGGDEGAQQLALGLLLRDVTRELWPAALYLSAAVALAPLVFSADAAAVAAAVAAAGAAAAPRGGDLAVPPHLAARIKARLAEHAVLAALVAKWQLGDVWRLKPLLNGKQIIALLGLRNGPDVGKYSEELLRWQMLHPQGASSDAEAFLRALQSAGGAPVVQAAGLGRVRAALLGRSADLPGTPAS